MDLIIKNNIIKGNLKDIINKIKIDSGKPYFKNIEDSDKNLLVTCPIHKNGREDKPSCFIYNYRKDPKITFGVCHCFSCGYKAPLQKLVSDCFNKDLEFGENWLIENFGQENLDSFILPEIQLENNSKSNIIDESILKKYNYYHPYMWKRKLNKEIVDKFHIGFDKDTNCITFPVWDEYNNLIMITKRSVESKKFYIDKAKEKPIYLLNYLLNNNITTAYVAESQINALTLQGWGYPGIAMLGGGSRDQYNILKKSGIRHYILCFDGDPAGDEDIKRFIKYMPKDILISVKSMPRDGRDINDMSKEEFDNLNTYQVY